MQTTSRLLILIFCLIILLWVWSAFYPSHFNWGLHLLAFYPRWYLFLCIGSLGVFLISTIRNRFFHFFNTFIVWCSNRPKLLLYIFLGCIFAAAMSLFPAKIHLLGDGDIILQLTPKDPNSKDISANFRDHPLMYYTVQTTQLLIGGGLPVEAEKAYRLIDLISGLIFFLLIMIFVNYQKIPPLDKVLIGCLLFFTTRLLFYFGYVENYSILSLLLTTFMLTGWFVLKNQINSIPLFLCFLFMIGFHLGSFIFFPSLIIVLLSLWRYRKKELFFSGGIVLGVGAVAFMLSDMSITRIAERVHGVYHNEILPATGWSYAIFSTIHFLDWVNAHALIIPFCLTGTIILLSVLSRKGLIIWKDPLLLFLLTSTLCGFTFTSVISPALGMARDWDLVATFFIPAGFLFIYLVKEYLHYPEARQIVLMIIVMQFIQTVSWIGINSDETRHLQRAEILTNPSMGGTIPKVYYESLGKIYWQRKDYKRAEFWYERYLTIDSLNPRILANLADVYKKSGENEKSFEVLKRSAGASRDPAVFSNLGVEYLKRNDTTLAIQMYQNALKIDSSFAYAHANLSLIYTAQHKNSLIAYHATRAITFGMTEPILYKFAGNAFRALNEIEQALKYYSLYLAKKPDDAKIISMIEKLQKELLRRKQSR